MNQRAHDRQATGNAQVKMGIGMVIGMAFGLAIGLAMDNIAIGVAIGSGAGIALGVSLSGQKQEPSKGMITAGVILVAVGVIVLAVVLHLVEPQWWCQYPALNLIPGC